MGSSLTAGPRNRVVHDSVIARRKRSFFQPLLKERRLKRIDYLFIASEATISGVSERTHEKQKLENVQSIMDAFKEYDWHFCHRSSRVRQLLLRMETNQFEDYINDLFTGGKGGSPADAFVIYYTGEIKLPSASFVLSSPDGKPVSVDLFEVFLRWRKVPNRLNKHLLLIIDSPDSGYLELALESQRPFEMEDYEDHFGLRWKGGSRPFRKDPSISIIVNSHRAERYEDDEGESTSLESLSEFPSEQLRKRYSNTSRFTAMFSEYLRNSKAEHIWEIHENQEQRRNSQESNDDSAPESSIQPYFFGFEVKFYQDFGIFPWVTPLSMAHQLEINHFLENELEDPERLEKQLLLESKRGNYFGILSSMKQSENFKLPSFVEFEAERIELARKKKEQNEQKQQIKVEESNAKININGNKIDRFLFGCQDYLIDSEGNPFFEAYEGIWKKNRFSRFGIYYYANGDKYEGEFRKGWKHGYGIFYFNNGDRYSGEFRLDTMHGQGRMDFSNGHVYVGNFRSNFRCGFGIYLVQQGSNQMLSYGEWRNNQQDGLGRVIFTSHPSIELNIDFSSQHISGEVYYQVADEDPNNEEEEEKKKKKKNGGEEQLMPPLVIHFKANWFNGRRITDIVTCPSTFYPENTHAFYLKKHLPKIKEVEKIHSQFTYPLVSFQELLPQN